MTVRGSRLRPWLTMGGAAVVLALALPGPGWWPLVLLFPGLFLTALDGKVGRTRAFVLGLVAGIVHWAVATSWVVGVMHDFGGLPMIAAVASLILMAAILGFGWAVVAWLTVAVPVRFRMWMFPCAWIAVEAARQLPPYLFPWNSTAACFASRHELLGSLPTWGASGLGWAAVAAGAALWGMLRARNRRAAALTGLAVVALAVAATLAAPPPRPAGPPIRVAVIQPGTTLDEKWDPSMWAEIMGRVWSLSREAAADGVDLLLWPESAVPLLLENDPSYRRSVIALAEELDAAIVINSIGAAAGGGYSNSVYLVTADGVADTRYDKVRLVPFGEYVPEWARVAFAEALVREVGSFTAGESPVLLDAGAPLGIALCYEIVFADVVAAEVRAGARLIVTLTNDGWYGDSWALRQHFAQAVLRAVENRRWVARAALTGISGIVDPHGRVRARIEAGETGHLVARVQPAEGVTPRARWGDWWAVLCALATVVIIVSTRRRSPSVKEDQ